MARLIPIALQDARETRSTCPYCGVGCGVLIRTEGTTIVDVRGDPDHPANFGRLCSKGSTLHLTAAPHIAAQARLLHPMRRSRRGIVANNVIVEHPSYRVAFFLQPIDHVRASQQTLLFA